MKEREKFSSRLGFILVSAGCAIGLGNVWKFPYICGQNGGAAFILIYLIFLLILGYPILNCEFSVGRASQKGIAKCYDILEPKGRQWHKFKWAGICGNYLLMMFYTMVGGWMLYYVYRMACGELATKNSEQIGTAFAQMQKSPATMTFWMVITVIIAFGICALGLNNGVEKITKVMMCLLIILMIVLAVNSIFLKGSSEGIKFYLLPNLERIRQRELGNVIFDAMTHAFFTLSVGIGSMEIFGSYLDKERSIAGEAKNVVILDTLVALMAGFIIIPACFAYGVEPDAGPSLLFVTLPNVFNNMPGGRIWGTCFFIFMSFAALSTIIAVFENIIAFYIDSFGWSRKKVVLINIVAVIILSMPCVLGFNVLEDVQLLGEGKTIMDFEDFLVSYNILPLGSLVMVLFCSHKQGFGWENFIKETNTGKGMKFPSALKFYMGYILPAIIVVVYIKGYYDMFAKEGAKVLAGWMAFAFILLSLIFFIAFVYNKQEEKCEDSELPTT